MVSITASQDLRHAEMNLSKSLSQRNHIWARSMQGAYLPMNISNTNALVVFVAASLSPHVEFRLLAKQLCFQNKVFVPAAP